MKTIPYDIYKKIIGGSCIPVEYIENTDNNAYIDTGLQVVNIKGLMVDYQATQILRRIMCVAGGMRTTSDGNFYILFKGSGSTAIKQYAQYGTESYNFAQTNTNRQVVYLDDKKFYLNGELVNTFTSNKGTARHNIYLFAANYGGSDVQNRGFVGKIYSAKIFDNNGVVRDFYPCVNNNGVAGMFDVIGQTFYASASQDTFAHGQEIAPNYDIGLKIMQNGYPFHGLCLHKFTVDSVVMSLGDKITGDAYYKDNSLAVTMQEYVEYNGTRYYLVNPPTVVREGIVSDNGELKGMTKYSFEFYHSMYMLGNFPFTDVAVSSNEEKFRSDNKTFAWSGNLFNMVVKLNENLQGTQWTVDTNIEHYKQDGVTETSMWQKAAKIPDEPLSFDKTYVSEVLKTSYETWEIPFVIDQIAPTDARYAQGKRFLILFGTPSNEILDDQGEPFIFQFGKGVGLKNNSRTPRNNKIVTRLAGEGAERNVPFGYPQIVWTGNQSWNYTINDEAGMQPIEIGGQTIMAMSYPIYDGIVGGQKVRLIKHPFTRKTLMPSVYADTVNKKVNPNATGYNPDTVIVDYYDAQNINPLAPSFDTHQFEDIYPRLANAKIVQVLPYDDRIYVSQYEFFLYIVDKITNSLNEWEKKELNDLYSVVADKSEDSASASTGGSYTYSWKAHRNNYSGGYWYEVKYTSSNVNFKFNVYCGDTSPAEDVYWDDTLDDEGKAKQSYFKMTLPQLSFDLYASAAVTEEMTINMRSGQCLGCSFGVYVDWDDYKKNFYDDNGNFAPNGSQRDLIKYPKSQDGEITVIVAKDKDTFGTLMPNDYQQPSANDDFVILGISLPQSYVTAAEQELDGAMREYIEENNIYYYDYPLKFDEYFLATHQGILKQIKNNSVVRFQYAGSQMALFVKQITIKYGEKPLPQYDITLTDDVEIVLNKIGQVTDDVSRMRVQVSELQKYYSENLIQEINTKLSKVIDDVCQGRITFQQGLDAIGNVVFSNEIRSSEYSTGLYTGHGWRIDELGNAELESLRVRSYLEVVELLINRMQAQEGDTMFTDNDQIDKVDRIVDPNDNSVTYILSLKEKYEDYFTSQMYGNILRGIINTLAAKQAGVSDESHNHTEDQGSDDGGNIFYTSWMRVIGTYATEPQTLGVNQIRVVLYGDNDVPAGRNFEPCELMTIARWGCFDYSDPSDPDYAATKASIVRRQRVFVISTTDGRVVKYTGVDSPILRNENYGVTIGELPEFVKNYPDVRTILNQVGEHTDWLYAQGVVVGNFVKVDREGLPIPTTVFCGDWIDGNRTEPLTIQVWNAQQQRYVDHVLTFPIPSTEYNNPESLYIGHGIYFYNQYNALTQQYETHRVRHNGGTWSCLQSLPVVSGGVATYHEPTWGSHYWNLIDAYDQLHVEIESSMGEVFNDGAVATTLTPILKCGNVDITSDTQPSDWKWERRTESGTSTADINWNSQHTSVRILNVTTQDMPAEWSETNKAIFTASVTISTPSGRSITLNNE